MTSGCPRYSGVVKMGNSKDTVVPGWKLQVPDFAVSMVGNWYLKQKGVLKSAD